MLPMKMFRYWVTYWPILGDVLADNGSGLDSDVDGDTLTVSTTPVSGPSDGALTLNANGTFTYTSDLNFNGVDSFQYQVGDGNGGTDQGTVTITVNSVNDLPVALDDSFVTDEDVPLSGDVLADNGSGPDSDVDGDTLTVSTTPVAGPSDGALTLNANGTFTYTPDLNFNGVDSFQYQVGDGNGGFDNGDVGITITSVDDPPQAVDDPQSVAEDSVNTLILVLANDTDVDGGPININSFVQPANGTVLLVNAGTSFSYTPDANYCNDGVTTDDFTYTLTPGGSSATVRVTVTCLPDPPLAGVDDYTSVGNTVLQVGVVGVSPSVQVTGSVLDNDVDPDGTGPLTVPGTSGISAGASVSMNADGTFTYTPPRGLIGIDSFDYTLSNGAVTSTGTVNVTMTSRVWYIDNSFVGSGDGRSSSPYQSMAAFSVVNGSPPSGSNPADGDTIFVAQGSGDYPGGVVLLNNQSMVGNGVTLTEGPLTIPPAARPNLSTGIVISDSNSIRGLNITATTNDGIVGNNAGGTTTLDQVSIILSGAGSGMALTNQSGSITFSNGSIDSTSAGAVVDINGGNAAFNFNSTNIVKNGSGSGISIANKTGGSVAFDSASGVTLSNITGDGIFLSSNTGSFNFTGGLNITNSGGTGLTATNSGTLTIPGINNTINTTNGIGLSLSGTTIGGGGITFQRISSTNATNGIVLDNTGANPFSITGSGTTDGSGGTIQDTTGSTMVDGISLTNASNVSLSNMTLTNANEIDAGGTGVCDGNTNLGCNAAVQLSSASNVTLTNVDIDGAEEQCINGNAVVNLQIIDSIIQNCGNQINEHGIHIRELLGTAANGNTNRITNTTVRAANTSNVEIVNTTATNSNNQSSPDLLVVTNSTFSDLVAPNGSNGISLLSRSNGNVRLEVSNSIFRNLRGIGLKLNGEQGGDLQSDITSSTFEPGIGQLTVGIETLLTQNSTHILNIHDNTKIETDTGTPVNLRAFNSASFTGRVTNNAVIQNSSSSGNGNGIQAVVDGSSGNSVVLISGNTIQQSWFGRGIRLDARAGSGRLDATVLNNIINSSGDLSNDALEMFAGNGAGGEASTICVNLSGNSVASGAFSDEYAAEQVAGNTFLMQSLTPASGATEAQVEAFIASTDTNPGGVTADVSPAGFGIVVAYQAATCNAAPAPLANQG